MIFLSGSSNSCYLHTKSLFPKLTLDSQALVWRREAGIGIENGEVAVP